MDGTRWRGGGVLGKPTVAGVFLLSGLGCHALEMNETFIRRVIFAAFPDTCPHARLFSLAFFLVLFIYSISYSHLVAWDHFLFLCGSLDSGTSTTTDTKTGMIQDMIDI